MANQMRTVSIVTKELSVIMIYGNHLFSHKYTSQIEFRSGAAVKWF